MIRFAEAVLPGHPDKFCDQVADAIVAEALAADPCAFAQIEVAVWSDRAWLSGRIETRRPLERAPAELLIQTGLALGFDEKNWIDARRYHVTDTICREIDDPREWRAICDDQSIVVGYAGYDYRTRWLPPEQFLVHWFREALWSACRDRQLQGCGPDGKLLISLREEPSGWHLERVLVTIQHRESPNLLDIGAGIQSTLCAAYEVLQQSDPRWCARWREVDLTVNPNGPYVRGGSDGDNGQTGRKLVVDYYGPRIPIGGGALSGKHPAHIDRMAAYAARDAAIHAVITGARQCTIQLIYAPNRDEPLEVVWHLDGRGEQQPRRYFRFDEMIGRVDKNAIERSLGQGLHFWDPALPWNRGSGMAPVQTMKTAREGR